MFIIESKYGNDGYAVWFKILESLAKTDDHWLDLKDVSNMMYLCAKCRISSELLNAILNDLSDLGEIDSELWRGESLVWSEKFIDSVEDAYTKRGNKPIKKEDLIHKMWGLGRCKPPKDGIKDPVKPHSIVKDIIPNDTKEEIVVSQPPHPLIQYIIENAPTVLKLKEPLTNDEAEKIVIDLEIKTKAQGDALRGVVDDMENKPDLLKKYKSANRTIRKWYANTLKWSVNPNYNNSQTVPPKLDPEIYHPDGSIKRPWDDWTDENAIAIQNEQNRKSN
jgi:hypothetical protein